MIPMPAEVKVNYLLCKRLILHANMEICCSFAVRFGKRREYDLVNVSDSQSLILRR